MLVYAGDCKQAEREKTKMKAIRTKYSGPTNTRGSRIIATDEDGNRISVPYECEFNSERAHAQGALALCKKLGWKGTLTAGSLGTGYVFVWADKGSEYTAE